MKRFWVCLFLSVSLVGFAQQLPTIAPSETKAMLAAVSRDGSLIAGGIGPGRHLKPGRAFVEPIAYLADSGKWESLPCGAGREGKQPKDCKQFAWQYLSKPHTYIVVSSEGEGATVHSAPTKLSECSDYTAYGSYSGASITRSAIAASNPGLFSHIEAPKALQPAAAKPINRALETLVPKKLDSTKKLKVISLRLEGRELFVVQREFTDISETEKIGERRYIFAIGAMDGSQFRVLHWKQNSVDEEEGILGVIRLNSGREFLITSVCDCEGQWFRVYGMQDGYFTLVFSGGGSSR